MMTEMRGEGLAGLVAKLAERWEAVSKYTSDRGYKTALISCAGELRNTAEAAAPPSTPHELWESAKQRERLAMKIAEDLMAQNMLDVPCKVALHVINAALATPSPQAPKSVEWFKERMREQVAFDDAQANPYLPPPAATQEQPAGSGADKPVRLEQPLRKLRKIAGELSAASYVTGQKATAKLIRQCVDEIINLTLYEPGSPRKVGEDGALKADDYRLVPVRLVQRFGANVPGNESDTRWTVCLPNGDYAHLFPEYLLSRPSSVPVGEQKQEEGV